MRAYLSPEPMLQNPGFALGMAGGGRAAPARGARGGAPAAPDSQLLAAQYRPLLALMRVAPSQNDARPVSAPMYAYAENNPVTTTDPDGTWTKRDIPWCKLNFGCPGTAECGAGGFCYLDYCVDTKCTMCPDTPLTNLIAKGFCHYTCYGSGGSDECGSIRSGEALRIKPGIGGGLMPAICIPD